MKPIRSKRYTADRLLNPQFVYRNSADTDITRTFARAREELEKKEPNVRQIRRKP